MRGASIDFNTKFGPGITSFNKNNSFIIPIQPEYHAMLFPEYEKQISLWPGIHPCGNSIKKAYLSHSKSKQISRGDNIFFYRSKDFQSLTAIGIVENTFRSKNTLEIARYVGKRTVYMYNEIEKMCYKNEILAIKFRLVSFLNKPIKLNDIIENSGLKAPPQSITKVGNIKWIQEIIEM